MTLAGCFVTAEGVVLGADSTTSVVTGGGPHYFDHAQKLFQVDPEGGFGIVTWGTGFPHYRQAIARFGDDLTRSPPSSVKDAAERWSITFWDFFSAQFADDFDRARVLAARRIAGQQLDAADAAHLKVVEESFVGFCLAGCIADRRPAAFELGFRPLEPRPNPVQVPDNRPTFWGAPKLVHRILYGADDDVVAALMSSGKWTGTEQELIDVILRNQLVVPVNMPIREALDFVHAAIHMTIKLMKFSHLPPICGGPVELAVITADRPFRWVRHKPLDAAL
jgi:hypothetical protein